MPTVLCGLHCLDSHLLDTAEKATQELIAQFNLDPALSGPGNHGVVELYRLERLEPHAQLLPEDVVVCRVPGWGLDLAALEDLHRQVEELQSENETIRTQHARTKEALMSLNSTVEANEAAEAAQRRL